MVSSILILLYITNFKVADLEQKSEKIENVVTEILSNIVQKDENLTIETSSFLINHLVLSTSNLKNSINLKKNKINLPSFCELINNIHNCSEKIITQKVRICLFFVFIKNPKIEII